LRQEEPVIDLRLLAKPSFSLACVMIFFMGVVLYGSSVLLPLLVQSQFGYDATLAGLVLSPGGFALVFLMPLCGRLVGRVQARYMIAMGMAILTCGLWYTMHVTPQADYRTFVQMRIAQVAGFPFLFIPISTLAFLEIPKEKSSKASAIYSLSRNMGGSVGIALLASYLARHQQIEQAALAAHLSPVDPVYRSTLAAYSHAFRSRGMSLVASGQAAVGRMYQELIHQAAILAYHDSFLLLASVTAVLAALALLMPRNDPHVKAKAVVEV
jgi:DHA2 family multidrug resistance protein